MILDLISLNTDFYIYFISYFLKIYNHYLWVLLLLYQSYWEKNIADLIFIDTKYEKALIHILQDEMLFTKSSIYF